MSKYFSKTQMKELKKRGFDLLRTVKNDITGHAVSKYANILNDYRPTKRKLENTIAELTKAQQIKHNRNIARQNIQHLDDGYETDDGPIIKPNNNKEKKIKIDDMKIKRSFPERKIESVKHEFIMKAKIVFAREYTSTNKARKTTETTKKGELYTRKFIDDKNQLPKISIKLSLHLMKKRREKKCEF